MTANITCARIFWRIRQILYIIFSTAQYSRYRRALCEWWRSAMKFNTILVCVRACGCACHLDVSRKKIDMDSQFQCRCRRL